MFSIFLHIKEKRDYDQKLFLLRHYLLDIVNTSENSHMSKMLNIVGISVDNFNETLVFLKKRTYNEQVIHNLF